MYEFGSVIKKWTQTIQVNLKNKIFFLKFGMAQLRCQKKMREKNCWASFLSFLKLFDSTERHFQCENWHRVNSAWSMHVDVVIALKNILFKY